MSQISETLIAACGLSCGDCDIRLVPFDAEAVQRVIAWFHQKGWLKQGEGVTEILERKMYCMGCHGDRSLHWSPDCWILKCCVDDKRHEFCYKCVSFPCERLSEWAKQSDDYSQALQRLKKMKEGYEKESL